MISACSADHSVAPAAAAVHVPGLPSSATLLRWSDPDSWPTHSVPTAGQDVTIPPQDTVVLDGSTPVLGAVTIQGMLVADTGVVALNAARIDVLGRLQAGSASQPYAGQLTITLVERPGDHASDTKGIVVHGGGQLELYGQPRVLWTHLAADAPVGAQQIQLADGVDWHAGDRIVVAPSGFDYTQVDLATVQSGTTNSVTLMQPLRYAHSGRIQVAGGISVDERAEVGLLTHNIVVQGDSLSETSGHGGHVMVLYGGSAHVDGIELYRMGQRGQMGRYPFHWHLAGSVPGQFIRNSSVWHSFNRCTTIHGTNDALVENNVCFDHAGHGYFIEDGIETGNTLKHNFVTYSRPGSLLPSDDQPASFWITNPDNTFEGNVAGGSQGPGFWFTPPLHPTGPSATTAVWPAYTPLRRFDGNVAHSSDAGISLEEDHREASPGFDPGDFPRSDATPNGTPVMNVFSHYTAYATGRGFWVRGDHQRIEQSVFADNAIDVIMGSAALNVEGVLASSVLVGRTGNPLIPAAKSMGVVLYDGPVSVSNVTFVNFNQPRSAAISGQDMLLSIRVSPRFTADHLTLIDSRPIYVPTTPTDDDGFASIRDLDGTLTGTAGAQVIPQVGFLSDPSCTAVADWNASLCTAPYVSVGTLTYDLGDSTAILKDGVPLHTWTGTTQPMVSITVPANHSYEFATPDDSSSRGMEVDGLTGTNSVTLGSPWHAASAHVVARGLAASPDTLPLVSSFAALQASTTSAAFNDTTARKLFVRIVGPVAMPKVELGLSQ